jgi:adsorption protein B
MGRQAFATFEEASSGRPFREDSLTEDYALGLSLRRRGTIMHFAWVEDLASNREPVSTKEFFPNGFWASVRQRSRWILGTGLQSWAQEGWDGPWALRYCLWRDRKAVLTNALVLGAYGLVFYALVRWGLEWGLERGGMAPWPRAQLLARHSWVEGVLLVNVTLAIWRLALKVFFVGRIYGPLHGLLSIPRSFLGNALRILATQRALAQYFRHRVLGKPLVWLKTTHVFPTAALTLPSMNAVNGMPSRASLQSLPSLPPPPPQGEVVAR